MFTEGYFLLGTKNLLIMMLCSFIKLLTVPLLLAEVVFAMRTRTGARSKRRYWFRLLLVVPGVVSTLMWKNIYDPNIGALNSLLDAAGLSHLKHSWLGEESTALWSIIFMGFSFVNSFAFLVYYGGLINIPVDLFEAAKVDGSRPLWNFRHIHMPLISPQMKNAGDYHVYQFYSGIRQRLSAHRRRPGYSDLLSGIGIVLRRNEVWPVWLCLRNGPRDVHCDLARKFAEPAYSHAGAEQRKEAAVDDGYE